MRRCRMFAASFILIASLAVLVSPVRAESAEDSVRATFTAYQKALKAGDAEQLWPLLDKASQTAADKAAASLKSTYAKASAKDKVRYEKMFGLKSEEMMALTGKLYLKTKRFLGKYDEVADSKINKIDVAGDRATLTYIEADGDKIQQPLVRQDGKWRVTVKIP